MANARFFSFLFCFLRPGHVIYTLRIHVYVERHSAGRHTIVRAEETHPLWREIRRGQVSERRPTDPVRMYEVAFLPTPRTQRGPTGYVAWRTASRPKRRRLCSFLSGRACKWATPTRLLLQGPLWATPPRAARDPRALYRV